MEFDGKNNKNSKHSNLKRRHGNGQGSLQMSKKSKTEMTNADEDEEFLEDWTLPFDNEAEHFECIVCKNKHRKLVKFDLAKQLRSHLAVDHFQVSKNEIKSEIKTEIKKEPLDEMDEIFKRGNDLLLQRKTKKEAESEEKDDVFKKVDKILNKSKTKTQNTPLKGPQNNSKIESPPKLNLQPALTPFNGMVMEVSVFFLFI